MRQVELVPGIRSSALGFGCAPILGAVDAPTAQLAVRTALEEGINHFDIAPSYGYGAAEAWLGRELKAQRDGVVIATKFGIAATWQARLLAPLKPLIRALRPKRGSQSAKLASNQSGKNLGELLHKRLPITAIGMRSSVERSLGRLRTDYLDYLFLHEPIEMLADLDGLAAEAERLKTVGKIRGWGLAYLLDQQPTHSSYLERFDILQFNLSLSSSNYDIARVARSGKANVFFSALQCRSASLPTEIILRKMGADFPNSIVLCSMFNPAHIRKNARAC